MQYRLGVVTARSDVATNMRDSNCQTHVSDIVVLDRKLCLPVWLCEPDYYGNVLQLAIKQVEYGKRLPVAATTLRSRRRKPKTSKFRR